MTKLTREKRASKAPEYFVSFVAEARQAALARGLAWAIPLDERGFPLKGKDWDLRLLNDGHERHAPGTAGFGIEQDIRNLAIEAGWPIAKLPFAPVLDTHAQDFLKALIVHRCLAQRTADSTQTIAKAARRLFSVTSKVPWEISREDFEELLGLKNWSSKAIRDFGVVGTFIDAHLLSNNCPVRPEASYQQAPSLIAELNDRSGAEKLPDKAALLELCRIVFQEKPKTFNDGIWFAILRLAMLTGLRIVEVMTLPNDCLAWEEHVDHVTGSSASAIGGVARSLRLRYFAAKHRDGIPGLLVEKTQYVPSLFEPLVVSAIEEVLTVTLPLRKILRLQSNCAEAFPDSDLRTARTSSGALHATHQRLFLTLRASAPFAVLDSLSADTVISTPIEPRLYHSLGRTNGNNGSLSFFEKYGKSEATARMSLRTHSLRHLMNTELFRQNVSDTAITHHFGRMSVAQSYEYDHRTLAEKLRFVELPDSARRLVDQDSVQELAAKMVISGNANTSHLGKSFKRIQAEHGDEAAFRYLAANSDGFHVTPYGFCTNSFSINPCARHLKCFDNCKHFTASGLNEHRVSLGELRARLLEMRKAATAKPCQAIGRANQIAHATRLIEGVDAALEAQPNSNVFADGEDHAAGRQDLFK
ncbi:hypothetical protein ACSFBX_13635 [Variovorax sp. RB2P76]|uniref:hypothetical protein n=1 Tax=Variovorax sp. RB2P76 TaxID=3443736 RepID=UPI003F486701